MSLNASGVRDTARVLRISTDTVLRKPRHDILYASASLS
jgi:hypothetical protein